MIELACSVTRGSFSLDVALASEHASVGLFGPSGSGKTSLLHAAAGLSKVERLRLVLDGDVLVDTERGVCPKAHRRRVGMVFQEHRLFPHRTLEANLRYGMPSGGGGPRFDEVVDLLALGPHLGKRPAHCSGGQAQRAALGRALLSAPRLLLLDEPLASLDRGLKRRILPYLRRVRDHVRLPMLFVSHDLGELLALTDELVLLDEGRQAGRGTLVELASDPSTLDLLHDCGLVFSMPGQVLRRDAEGVTWVAPDSVSPSPTAWACGDCDLRPGRRVEVVLRPEDIVLALPPLEARLSLRNRILGRVVRVTRSPSRVVVTLDAGLAQPLLAEVTEGTVRALGLEPGREVIALWKAQAVQVRALS